MDGTDPQQAAHPEAGALPAEAAWIARRAHPELGDRLREVLELAPAVRHAFAHRLSLSEHELEAMEHLMSEPMGPVELSRRLGVTSAAATQLLDRLAGLGHVERRPHPGDRRRKIVVATGSAMTGVFRELQPMVEALDAVADELDDAEREVVMRYLERVVAVLKHTVEHGRPDA